MAKVCEAGHLGGKINMILFTNHGWLLFDLKESNLSLIFLDKYSHLLDGYLSHQHWAPVLQKCSVCVCVCVCVCEGRVVFEWYIIELERKTILGRCQDYLPRRKLHLDELQFNSVIAFLKLPEWWGISAINLLPCGWFLRHKINTHHLEKRGHLLSLLWPLLQLSHILWQSTVHWMVQTDHSHFLIESLFLCTKEYDEEDCSCCFSHPKHLK